jgi:Domain of Unknown Function (DUF928)
MNRRLQPRLILIASAIIAFIGLTTMRDNFLSPNASVASIRFVPPPPPDLGEPGGRPEGGGSRGCQSIALVPQTAIGHWGQTTAERPTFWFRLATARNLSSNDRLRFVLRDEAKQVVYQTEFAVPNIAPGIIKLSLPNTVAPLKTQALYRWEFSLGCDAATVEDRPSTVVGTIQRVALTPAIASQIAATTTPLEQAKLYASQGMWYDAVTLLGNELQPQTSPDPAIASAWKSLLEQVNLTALEAVPFTPCCSL